MFDRAVIHILEMQSFGGFDKRSEMKGKKKRERLEKHGGRTRKYEREREREREMT
jgi:hypothetical protein